VKYEGFLEFPVTPDTVPMDRKFQNFSLKYQRKSRVYLLAGDEFLAPYFEILFHLHVLELGGH
jgi:hypothetical protein